MASPEQTPPVPERHARESLRRDARRRALAFGLVFLAAFGVRLLCWRDARFEAHKVQTAVTENYKHMARLLGENGAASFYDPSSPTSEPDLLGHPPGYPFVLAAVYAVFGESDAAAQIFQAACDALAAVLVFLIAAELLTFGVGVVAGALAALAPQFCWNSLMLLPDTLAVLPLLGAVWLLACARAGGGRCSRRSGPARSSAFRAGCVRTRCCSRRSWRWRPCPSSSRGAGACGRRWRWSRGHCSRSRR